MKFAPDIAGTAGLILIGIGCWQYSPALAAIIIGSILFLLSCFAFWSRSRKGGD